MLLAKRESAPPLPQQEDLEELGWEEIIAAYLLLACLLVYMFRCLRGAAPTREATAFAQQATVPHRLTSDRRVQPPLTSLPLPEQSTAFQPQPRQPQPPRQPQQLEMKPGAFLAAAARLPRARQQMMLQERRQAASRLLHGMPLPEHDGDLDGVASSVFLMPSPGLGGQWAPGPTKARERTMLPPTSMPPRRRR